MSDVPKLAICLPVGASGVPLEFAVRTVAALAAQDVPRDRFEVCVGLDGAPPGDTTAEARLVDAGADVVVRIERTPGNASLAHRNHARNAAWRSARAPLCLMLDADFILPPHAVRTIIAEQSRLIRAGVPAVLSPALCQFGGVSTADWLALSRVWAAMGHDCADAFKSALREWGVIDRGTFSGFGGLAGHPATPPAPGAEVSRSVGSAMLEGMPVLPRRFLEAVGGFDEVYVGWGGDKISLVDVLRGMCAEGVMEIRVLHGVVAMHQPHATDPHHTSEGARRNEHRRQLARMEIESRTLPWRRRVGALGRAMHDGWADFASVAGVADSALDDPASSPPAEVVAGLVQALKSPRMQGAPVVVVGPSAVARACEGQARRHVQRAAFGDAATPGAVLVLVSPMAAATYPDAAAMAAALDDVRAKSAALCPGGRIIVAQRLDELPRGGRATPGYLRPVDMQDRMMSSSATAQVLRAGGQIWALASGRL